MNGDDSVRVLRAKLGMTQSELARLLRLNSHAVVSNWECGRQRPNRQAVLLLRLAVEFPYVLTWLRNPIPVGVSSQTPKRHPAQTPTVPSAAPSRPIRTGSIPPPIPVGYIGPPLDGPGRARIWSYIQERGKGEVQEIIDACRVNCAQIYDNVKLWRAAGLVEFNLDDLSLIHALKGEVRLAALKE